MNALTEEQIVAAIIGAVVGLFIGYMVGRRSAPGSEQMRDLEKELSAARSAKASLESKVDAHFSDTATKMNALTENYRGVYEHLASGAAELGGKSASQAFAALTAPASADTSAIDNDSVMVEAPRDYAPKTSPDDPGVLNERFGLADEDTPPEEKSNREQDA